MISVNTHLAPSVDGEIKVSRQSQIVFYYFREDTVEPQEKKVRQMILSEWLAATRFRGSTTLV